MINRKAGICFESLVRVHNLNNVLVTINNLKHLIQEIEPQQPLLTGMNQERNEGYGPHNEYEMEEGELSPAT